MDRSKQAPHGYWPARQSSLHHQYIPTDSSDEPMPPGRAPRVVPINSQACVPAEAGAWWNAAVSVPESSNLAIQPELSARGLLRKPEDYGNSDAAMGYGPSQLTVKNLHYNQTQLSESWQHQSSQQTVIGNPTPIMPPPRVPIAAGAKVSKAMRKIYDGHPVFRHWSSYRPRSDGPGSFLKPNMTGNPPMPNPSNLYGQPGYPVLRKSQFKPLLQAPRPAADVILKPRKLNYGEDTGFQHEVLRADYLSVTLYWQEQSKEESFDDGEEDEDTENADT